MNKLYIAGIDPSLTGTGICVMNQNDVEDFEVFTIKSKVKGMQRLDEIETAVMSFVKDASNVFIEGLAFGARGRAILDLAGLGNILRLSLYRAGFIYWNVPPTILKKYVTSKGNAKKELMLEQCLLKFGKGSSILKDSDQVDAYCLARFGVDFLNWENHAKESDFKKYEVETFRKMEACQFPNIETKTMHVLNT